MSATNSIHAARARLYDSVRTAHLERAHQLEPAAIVYRRTRYDFDSALADGLEMRRTTIRGVVPLMLSSRIVELEVNEPMDTGLFFTAAALAGLAVRRLLGGPPAVVVTYAIGNLDPADILRRYRGPKSRARLLLYRLVSGMVWRRLDRIVYGTEAAREVYAKAFRARPELDQAVVPALPVARAVTDTAKRPGSVVFLGALVERKGFPLLLEAWPLVHRARPDATLSVVGKGALTDLALDAAAADPSMSVVLDPPRQAIFEILDGTQTLVLPSRPQRAWREQVGLPIVEGLSSGCSIVTTEETGIADWLAEHGHTVVPSDVDATALAESIVATLDAARPASSVTADLPEVDGRLAADRALFRTTR